MSALRFSELPEKLKYLLLRELSARLGWDVTLHTDDRRLLADVIFPWFAERPDVSRVLFVGCDWYTRRYDRVFAGKEYWTIDKSERQAAFGAARHVTDALMNLGRHLPPDHFDLIVCNGVVGFGLDDRDEAKLSFAAVRDALRPGGVLLLGWNDVPRRRPFAVEEVVEAAGLRPHVFPPLETARYLTDTRNRHVYSFYAK